MQATAKDLQFHTQEILNTASRGEEVIITYHGKPYVKIVSLGMNSNKKTGKKTSSAALFGIWKDHAESEDVNAYMDQLRKGRNLP